MPTRIVFNGREYSSPEAMPTGVRQAYDQALAQLADADRNGIPDVVERGRGVGHVIGIQHTSITVNGRTYDNADDMPADVRRLYEDAMAQVDVNRDGIPDALQGGRAAADSDLRAQVFRREFTWGGGPGRRTDPRTRSKSGGAKLFLALAMLCLLVLLYLWL